MSKIPRSFVTPSSKVPTSMLAPASLEPPKINGSALRKITPPVIKHFPLSDKQNVPLLDKTPVMKPDTGKLKRNATTGVDHFPKKQIKLSAKVSSAPPAKISSALSAKVSSAPSAKIPPYDYKARFNELSEKHKLITSEYSDVERRFEENSAELESMKFSLDAVSDEKCSLSKQLEELSENHKQAELLYTELNQKYDTEVKTVQEIKTRLEESNNLLSEFKKKYEDVSTQLKDVSEKYAYKNAEYDTLKIAFENEVQKSLLLSSTVEENQVKLLSCSSQVTFLETHKKIIEQKNSDNVVVIAELKEKNDSLTRKLNKTEEDNINIKEKLDVKSQELKDMTAAYNAEVDKCAALEGSVKCNQETIHSSNVEINDLKRCRSMLEALNEKDSETINELKDKNIALEKTIQSMYEQQKVLRNSIQDLKGHIRVFCRIRPPLKEETSKAHLSVELLDACSMEIDKSFVGAAAGPAKKQNLKHNFTFDGIFPACSQQEDVFSEVSGLVQSALDGYNVCIFAYGQTGSGKTYTMEGGSDMQSSGIIPRTVEMIFSSLPPLMQMGWEFKITVSFLEIYNENIYDLLDSNKDQEDHSIKMTDSKGNDVYVSNLREESVDTAQDLLKLLAMSQKNRQTAATVCNERSSRSHSVTKIKISAFNAKRKEKYISNLNLVDLAGSESAKTSQRMDETKSINKSLLELSKVILALQSKQSHVPYRNSKLTYLLMPSLGGNSKTLMLVNVAQLDENYQETLNSLRFAAKVNSCRKSIIRKNITTA